MSAYIDFRAIAEESLSALPTSNLYFLLDHGGLPGLCSKLSKNSLKWASLFDCGRDASALEAAPILILAGCNGQLQMPRNLFEWIGREGTYTSTVIMLSSPLPIEAMTRRLADRLDVKLSDDMEAMLRFFDPRVLESLIKILSAEQLHALLRVAEVWRFSDRNGKVVRIDSTFDLKDDCVLPIRLSQEQEFGLIDSSEVDQVLSVLRRNVPDFAVRLPYSLQYDFVNGQIEAARNSGLNSTLKFSLYITVQLLGKEQFLGSSFWSNFLGKLKKDEIDLSGMFASENR